MNFNDLVLLAESMPRLTSIEMAVCKVVLDVLSYETGVQITDVVRLRQAHDVIKKHDIRRPGIYNDVCNILDNMYSDLNYATVEYVLDHAYFLSWLHFKPELNMFNQYFAQLKIENELKNGEHGMDLTF